MHAEGCVAHISGGNAKEHFIWASRSGPPSLVMLRVRIRTSDIFFSGILFCFHSYHPFSAPLLFDRPYSVSQGIYTPLGREPPSLQAYEPFYQCSICRINILPAP
ncbi:hypothetical protein I7I50_09474 [Histoplasma capsulatum G186AR]|uniref:Uncharacterized protein n=1 Tax=Ajellomyces capsulatus TaxID=5037 RepID=A0A8H7YQ01_AJECA|nr:hypothetical protein I7I52_06995 [Histoplasma capsulatum]QSS74348.1 hypothetical protein I7I50_09474 [Histoplasma capsulatum G186AR]